MENVTFLCFEFAMKNLSKFIVNISASQPPTTLPPPTTEAVETTTPKRVVNVIPPIGQTTMLYSVNMFDKGTSCGFTNLFDPDTFSLFSNNYLITTAIVLFLNITFHFSILYFFFLLGLKYQATYNEIEKTGGEQKFTDSSKSVDWTNKNDVSNKGDHCDFDFTIHNIARSSMILFLQPKTKQQ